MTEHPVSLRITEETMKRLDALADKLTERAAGAEVKRGTVLRLVVEKGIEALEGELRKLAALDRALGPIKKPKK